MALPAHTGTPLWHCRDAPTAERASASPRTRRALPLSDAVAPFNSIWSLASLSVTGSVAGTVTPIAVAVTAAAQRAVLVDLYVATNGSGWSLNTGWVDYGSGSDPCDDSWTGVTCSGTVGSSDRNV